MGGKIIFQKRKKNRIKINTETQIYNKVKLKKLKVC